jgi:antitoxin YefM
MNNRTTFAAFQRDIATHWDAVDDTREPTIIQRPGHPDMALLPAADLRRLQETVHLLSSPRNASRLLAALARARQP